MKKKKKLRGMSLIEIIVSIAVFAMISLILVMLGSAVNAHQRSTKRVNDKVAVQGPVAEAQNDNYSLLLDDEYEIAVSKKGSADTSVVVKGRLYSAQGYIIDDDGNKVADPDAEKANLKYIEIQNPNKSAVPAPSEPAT